MLRFTQRDVPFGNLDIAGIGHAGQQVGDFLAADFAIGQVFRELGATFEETLHLDLRVKAARRKTFQRLLHDGRDRLVANQHMPVAGHRPVFVPYRAIEYVVAFETARLHAVQRLLCILAALMLMNGGKDVFVEFAVGIVT
ncbi:MAG: hypothetical protein BGN94_22430 [Rhizobiales bacterium 68-8]|nr:MAG: hypothetical protein BGN94_22430 [Rhizobiales bacterium 68-8]